MANNLKFGNTQRITLKLTAAVEAGSLSRVNGFIGIPLNRRAAGESVSFAIEGIWGMTFAAYGGMATPPTAGSILYWDTSAGALSIGAANDDFPAVKVVTDVSSTDGTFDGLLLPQTRPYGQTQS